MLLWELLLTICLLILLNMEKIPLWPSTGELGSVSFHWLELRYSAHRFEGWSNSCHAHRVRWYSSIRWSADTADKTHLIAKVIIIISFNQFHHLQSYWLNYPLFSSNPKGDHATWRMATSTGSSVLRNGETVRSKNRSWISWNSISRLITSRSIPLK